MNIARDIFVGAALSVVITLAFILATLIVDRKRNEWSNGKGGES